MHPTTRKRTSLTVAAVLIAGFLRRNECQVGGSYYLVTESSRYIHGTVLAVDAGALAF